MFNENSALVATWAKLVKNGTYTIEQVPALFNLKEQVEQVLGNNGLQLIQGGIT